MKKSYISIINFDKHLINFINIKKTQNTYLFIFVVRIERIGRRQQRLLTEQAPPFAGQVRVAAAQPAPSHPAAAALRADRHDSRCGGRCHAQCQTAQVPDAAAAVRDRRRRPGPPNAAAAALVRRPSDRRVVGAEQQHGIGDGLLCAADGRAEATVAAAATGAQHQQHPNGRRGSDWLPRS